MSAYIHIDQYLDSKHVTLQRLIFINEEEAEEAFTKMQSDLNRQADSWTFTTQNSLLRINLAAGPVKIYITTRL